MNSLSLPVPFDIGGSCGLQFAGFHLLDGIGNGSGRAGVDFDVPRLKSCECLGSNIPGNHSFDPKFDNFLACLYARALSSIEIYCIRNGCSRMRICINDDEELCPAKARSTADCRLSPSDVIASFIRVLWISREHVTCQRVLTLRSLCYRRKEGASYSVITGVGRNARGVHSCRTQD